MKKKLWLGIMVVILGIMVIGCDNPTRGNGANGTGFRLVSFALIDPGAPTAHWSFHYDTDGWLVQVNNYSDGNRISYNRHTRNSAGLRLRTDTFADSDSSLISRTELEWENNLLKRSRFYLYWDSQFELLQVTEFTFYGDRKIKRESFDIDNERTLIAIFQYDSSGRRTGVQIQHFGGGDIIGTITGTRTYNANGTLSSVSYSDGRSRTFVWEEIAAREDMDLFFVF